MGAHSLSGMITKVKTQYGGVGEMIESPTWDESKTDIAVALLMKGLKKEVGEINKELSRRVAEKFGKDSR